MYSLRARSPKQIGIKKVSLSLAKSRILIACASARNASSRPGCCSVPEDGHQAQAEKGGSDITSAPDIYMVTSLPPTTLPPTNPPTDNVKGVWYGAEECGKNGLL